MTHEEFDEISGAYVLDAITPDERRAVEAHLAGCARCTNQLQELLGVVALLPLAVPQINPPAELAGRIRAAIQQEGRRPTSQRPASRTRTGTGWRRWTPQIAAIAAVLVISLLGGMVWNVSLQNQNSALQHQVGTLQTALQTALRHQQTTPTYAIQSTNPKVPANGQLIYLPDKNVTILIIHGLPQLKGAKVYQGWLLHLQGQKITGTTSVGLLNAINGTATLSFIGNVTGFDAAAISQEAGPMATPNAPKGAVVALGLLKQT